LTGRTQHNGLEDLLEMTSMQQPKDKPRQIRKTDQLDVSAARTASARRLIGLTYHINLPATAVGHTRWDQLPREQ
jgi:hypothetical protein